MTIRILLADDHKMFRETLRIPLEMEPDIEVVAEAGSGAELFAKLETVSAEVLILDIGLPDVNGIEIAQRLAKEHPQLKVVALSGYTDKIFVDEMVRAGARAFVAKAAGSDELILAVRAVVSGKFFISPEVAESVMRTMTPAGSGGAPPVSVLGKREQEVLRLLAEGKSSAQIAAALEIAPATVEVHRRNIKQKLGISSIAELTRYAIREGLTSVG